MLAALQIWRRRWKAGTVAPPPLNPPNPVSLTMVLRSLTPDVVMLEPDTIPRLRAIDTAPGLRSIP